LRSVNVTRAFDPSPPLRQDCDEILRPSTGGVSTEVFVSTGVFASAGVGSVGVISGLNKDAFCPDGPAGTGTATDWLSASPEAEIIVQVANPTMTTTGNSKSLDLTFPGAGFPERSPRPFNQAISLRASIVIATPSWAAKRTVPAAPHSKKPRGRYTARLLIRLPFCPVPPLPN
jgi:hypothetical protein